MAKLATTCQLSVSDHGSSLRVGVLFIGRFYLILNYIVLGFSLGTTMDIAQKSDDYKETGRQVQMFVYVGSRILLPVNAVCALILLAGVYLNKAVLLYPFMMIAIINSIDGIFRLLLSVFIETIDFSKQRVLAKQVCDFISTAISGYANEDLTINCRTLPSHVYSLCTLGVVFLNIYSLMVVYSYYNDMQHKSCRKKDYNVV